MISLKQCMAWVTGSNRSPSQTLRETHWRLLLAYVTAMTAIFGVSATTVYYFFYESRNQQVNSQLLTLVQAAAPSIETVKARGSAASLDKELPWQDLFSNQEQSLEWFTADGQRLAKEGSHFPSLPLTPKLTSATPINEPVIESEGHWRIMTIAIYTNKPDKKTLQLQGYLRASQSNQRFEASLNQLRLGLVLGGLIALLLASVSSLYLTQKAVRPMQLSFQRLTRFAADASHELRNPLTRIGIATEIMLSHPTQLKPADVKKLETIISATEQMRCLIDNVLFLARTDATHPPSLPEDSAISLDELLAALMERFKSQAQIKSIDLQEQLLPNLFVKGSSTPLDRLFSNLLENALKYTNPGGKVSVSMQKTRQNVFVSVEDTGIGIPSEYAPFIFQRFWRADQARSQEQDGFGLGLAIAQTIAKQHHGEITVSSEVGVGSRFKVRLPLA
jgi:two-component system, OmpR family, manganese sensing sensor histidine kinase